jgi:hypothetical protein
MDSLLDMWQKIECDVDGRDAAIVGRVRGVFGDGGDAHFYVLIFCIKMYIHLVRNLLLGLVQFFPYLSGCLSIRDMSRHVMGKCREETNNMSPS